MAKQDRGNLRITLLLYSFILSSSLCRGSTFAEDRKSMHPIETLESKVYPPPPRPEKVSTSPDIISSHTVYTTNAPLSPNEKVSDIVGSHTGKIPDTPLNLEEGVVALPDVVTSSHIDSNSNSPATKPIVIPPIKTDPETVLKVVGATVGSFYKSAQMVSTVTLILEQDFNRLQKGVILIEKLIKQLERRTAVASEVFQTTDNDLEKFVEVIGNDIPPEALAAMGDIQLFIRNEIDLMIYCTGNLEKRKETVKQIQYITEMAAKAEEYIHGTIMASQLALQHIRRVPNVKIKIEDKEVTALDILTETAKDSLTLLKTATEQKESIKALRQRILQIAETITQLTGNISKEIEKGKVVEKRIVDIETHYAKY